MQSNWTKNNLITEQIDILRWPDYLLLHLVEVVQILNLKYVLIMKEFDHEKKEILV